MVSDIDIRSPTDHDETAVRALFERLGDRDRTLFKEDITAPGVLEPWMRASGRFVAFDGDTAVGVMVIVPGVAWSRHVAQVRLVVDPGHRRCGTGRALARRGLVEAVEAGHLKLTVEVLADDDAALALFGAIGFDAEGILADQVCDRAGRHHDLVILSHFVGRGWSTMATTGLDELLLES